MNNLTNGFISTLMAAQSVKLNDLYNALRTGMDETNALSFIATLMMPKRSYSKTMVKGGVVRTLESVDLIHGSVKYSYSEVQFYKSEEDALKDNWPRRDKAEGEYKFKGTHKSCNSTDADNWPEGPDENGDSYVPLDGWYHIEG